MTIVMSKSSYISTDEFIELWEKEKALWDCFSAEYNTKSCREKSLEFLADHFNVRVGDIKSKINTLRSYYAKELSKQITEGSEHPKWLHFKKLDFLRSTIKSRKTNEFLENGRLAKNEQHHVKNETFEFVDIDIRKENDVTENDDVLHENGMVQYETDAQEEEIVLVCPTDEYESRDQTSQINEHTNGAIDKDTTQIETQDTTINTALDKTENTLNSKDEAVHLQKQQPVTTTTNNTTTTTTTTNNKRKLQETKITLGKIPAFKYKPLNKRKYLPTRCLAVGESQKIENNEASRKDDEDVFGQHVAMTLKSIKNNYNKEYAKLKIQEVLFEAQFGSLQ